MEINIKNLFKNLCCSKCKNEFENDSITIIHKDDKLLTINLTCTKCNKDFGLAYLNIEKGDNELEIQDGPDPINTDDVINAHNFIKQLDKNWQKYIPKSE